MLGCVFVLGSSFNWRITFGFLMIQSGVCGKMPLWIFVKEIVDSWRIGFIQGPIGFIDFSFFSKCCPNLGLKMQS